MSTPDLDTLDRHAVMGHLTGDDYDAIPRLVAEVRDLRDEVERLRAALLTDRRDTLVVQADNPREFAESGALDWWKGSAIVTDDTCEAVVDESAREVRRLRAAIREHRDKLGDPTSIYDERLWATLDDQETTP